MLAASFSDAMRREDENDRLIPKAEQAETRP
jgi:hypothetical protein